MKLKDIFLLSLSVALESLEDCTRLVMCWEEEGLELFTVPPGNMME